MLERLGRRRKPPSLLLRNLECYSDGEVFHGDLRLTAGRVAEIGSGLAAGSGERTLDLDGHLAYPGLINAHDHLELDFLPRLGSPPTPVSTTGRTTFTIPTSRRFEICVT